MVRHTDDNARKPRPRQEGRSDKPGFDRPRNDNPRPDKPRPDKPAKADGAPKRTERIAKAMARAGIASRREVERLIGLGKVAVNGRILDTPATLVTRDDVITVNGKPVEAAQATRVWRYHKPSGLVTSHNDPQGRETVFEVLPKSLPRVISVGRLDLNTEGLLLLTNDGELSRALELPSTELVRQYRARARGSITQAKLDTLKDGVTIDDIRYGPIEATLDKVKTPTAAGEKAPANLWISVSIAEGKNREVRNVLEHLGLTVNRLIRLAYGPFQLGTLPIGAVEEVGPRVIRELLAEHIRPENLPTGNTVDTPAPIPGRRSAPMVRGRSGSAMSDPSRKPSRVRAKEAAGESADGPVQKKPGWAKAKPKFEHKKTFKPRARPTGEAAATEDRPQRAKPAFTPHADQFIDDRRPAQGARKPGGKPGGFGGSRTEGGSGRAPAKGPFRGPGTPRR